MFGSFISSARADGIRELLGPATQPGGLFDSTDSLVILGYIFLFAVLLVCWACFIRKRPAERQGARVVPRRSESDTDVQPPFRHRGRRRRRSLDPMRRNPTLMEKGGLPPPRADEPQGSSSIGSPASVRHQA